MAVYLYTNIKSALKLESDLICRRILEINFACTCTTVFRVIQFGRRIEQVSIVFNTPFASPS